MMESLLKGYLDQLRTGIQMGLSLSVIQPSKEIRNVVISGQGSSAIGASVVQSLVMDEIQVPVSIVKSYDLPAFVNEHTLFIASSFSGNTEEILSLVEQAIERKATLACITGGGKLAEIAHRENFTISKIPYSDPYARVFIGFSITQLLFLLNHYRLISDQFISQIEAAIELLDIREYFLDDSAKILAQSLKGKLPILYGDARFEPVLRRFQQQINENSKQLAHVNVFPDLIHNEIEGWLHPGSILLEAMVVMLSTKFDDPRIEYSYDPARALIYRHSAGFSDVILLHGDSFLEQMLYAIHLFDWTSFYLAIENKEDPLESNAISKVKEAMKKENKP